MNNDDTNTPPQAPGVDYNTAQPELDGQSPAAVNQDNSIEAPQAVPGLDQDTEVTQTDNDTSENTEGEQADGYYGEDETVDGGEVDLSFLNEENTADASEPATEPDAAEQPLKPNGQ